MAPAFQRRPTTVTGGGPLAGGVATDEAGRITDPVQGGPRLVAHAAVAGDVRAGAGVLDDELAVQGDACWSCDGMPRFDDEAGNG